MTYSSLESVLAHIRAAGWTADLVAVTGDLTQDESAGAYRHFRELLTPLGLPVFCIPGNHDIRRRMKATLSDPPFQYCGEVEKGAWLIVGLDSCVSGHAGGRIGASELARMDTAIETSPAANVLVCLHHPPLPVGSKWLDRVGLENGEEFLHRISASGRVRGVIFGHVHQAFESFHNSIVIIGTPSTCRQFKVGSEDFALDGNPPAYRRITLHADGSVEHELLQVRP